MTVKEALKRFYTNHDFRKKIIVGAIKISENKNLVSIDTKRKDD